MPLKRFTDTVPVIDIPDADVQGLRIKRKATVQSLNISFESQQVIMGVSVCYYGDDKEPLNLPGMNGYTRSLIAGMDTLVNVEIGVPVCDISQEYIDEELNPALDGINYAYEFEFMMMLMHQPVLMYDMIIAKLQYAAAMGKLD